jgi:hypothetical protein
MPNHQDSEDQGAPRSSWQRLAAAAEAPAAHALALWIADPSIHTVIVRERPAVNAILAPVARHLPTQVDVVWFTAACLELDPNPAADSPLVGRRTVWHPDMQRHLREDYPDVWSTVREVQAAFKELLVRLAVELEGSGLAIDPLAPGDLIALAQLLWFEQMDSVASSELPHALLSLAPVGICWDDGQTSVLTNRHTSIELERLALSARRELAELAGRGYIANRPTRRRSPTETVRLRISLATVLSEHPGIRASSLLAYWHTEHPAMNRLRGLMGWTTDTEPPDRRTLERNWPRK